MLALERRNAIIESLNVDGKVLVSELSKRFDVTDETIRRDIVSLEKDGFATRTYGGAISNVLPQTDLPYNIRKKVNVDEKQYIAERVASTIKDGDSIMCDASSTAIYVIRKIKQKKNITVITNSVEILLELGDKPGWTILSTGGTLKEGAFSLFGSSALKMIEDHHVNVAICSAKGIDARMGITDSNEKDAEMKRAIFSQADKRILVLDSTKFDKISFVKVSDISMVDVIATDKDPGETWNKRLSDYGIELLN